MRGIRSRSSVILVAHAAFMPAAFANPDNNSHATAMAAMAEDFVGHVSFDGKLLTNVIAISNCRTSFVTAKGTVIVDWSRLLDSAPRTEGDIKIVPLTSRDGEHDLSSPLSVESGHLAQEMVMGVTYLYLDCAKPM